MPLRPNMQPQEFLEIFLRRKWFIIFSILFILFGVSVYCVVTPEMFKSSTTILVVPQGVSENFVKSSVSSKIEDRIATIRQQVQSRSRLVAVMDELGLFKEERKKMSLDGLVELMRKRITIEVRQNQNDAFTLSFLHEKREAAKLATSRLSSFFIDQNLRSREKQAVGTSSFLDSQLKITKQKLEVQEERVRQYKTIYLGELPQQLTANLAVMSRLQDQLKANADAIRTAQDRKMFTESQIRTLELQARTASGNTETASAELVSPSDPAAPYIPELNAKRAQLASLSTRFTDRYPEIRRLKEEIAQLENRVADVRSGAASSGQALAGREPTAPLTREKEEIRRLRTVLEGLDREILSLKRDNGEIRRSIAAIESKVDRSPKREQEMISLTRDYDNLKKSYDELLRKKLEADVAQNLEKRQKDDQFQILDPANLPVDPFVPNRPMVFGIALLVALLVGFGGAIGLEAADPTARGLIDFRHFCQIPVLSTIPTIHDSAFQRQRTLRLTTIYGGLGAITVAVIVFLMLYGNTVRIILKGGR